MIKFLLEAFYSFLPKSYWGERYVVSPASFLRAAMFSAASESAVSAIFLLHRSIPFLIYRAHQMRALAGSNEGTQLYFTGILIVEYLLQPLSLLLSFLTEEGVVRWFAAQTTEEVLPSLPVKVFFMTHEWYRKRQRQNCQVPFVPDLFETSEKVVRVLSCRPKEGWRESITVKIGSRFYEIAKVGTGTAAHPLAYQLREQIPGRVIRAIVHYDPPKSEVEEFSSR